MEVLFALAVVGLALGATAGILRSNLLGDSAARDVDAALALADEKLAAAGVTEPLRPGRTQGVFDRFHWQVTVAPFDDKESDDDMARRFRLFRVEARINWRDGARNRQVDLSTLRLTAAAP